MADIIFIYAEEDGGRVREICAALAKSGLSCDPDRSIPAGQTYSGYMADRLTKAKAAIMCWSASALAQSRLVDEAAAARDAGKLAPVSLDGSLPPLGFGQIQTANLADWPGTTAKAALDTLAAALFRMRDGEARTISHHGRLSRRPFIWTWKFWLLSLLTAAAIGALAFLSPEGRSQLGEGVAERLTALSAYVVLALFLTPLSRALLHFSQRVMGLDSRAFFSAGYLLILALSLAAGAALFEYYQITATDSPDRRASLLLTLCTGATFLPLALSILVFLLNALRRLAFGPAKAP